MLTLQLLVQLANMDLSLIHSRLSSAPEDALCEPSGDEDVNNNNVNNNVNVISFSLLMNHLLPIGLV